MGWCLGFLQARQRRKEEKKSMHTIVGIDIGKFHHQATVLNPDGNVLTGTQ